ncbi:MFS transporter [Ureibacillus massiliensis 4400831 = CIP 108448 = CCUG 49529]|uniref:MFS transporter n=1 Tax=Ureibacillus massiliensis 4400831 = CIP 108448 = CCUG 49529 TaxID=1211035 RepID=A0A0A3J5D3_9BACL|nr:MFS transporter [Ureibacillus massiliensis]KGR92244.1 MFS transporter [Ureibacillus massiliensis 4400831 = CIP 108448 = CCUG 49529]
MAKSLNKRLPGERSQLALYMSLPILSWAFYDFANTIFSSNINTIFFPFYMDEVLGTNEVMQQVASTFISYANAVASFFIVIFSPLFGVWIDNTGYKKRFIVWFASLSIFFTFMMGIFAEINNDILYAGIPLSLCLTVISFVIAKFFFNSSLVFYDSMMSDLGTKKEMPLISGFGVAIGYFGTIVGLLVYLLVSDGNYHRAFIPTAILYLIFSLPLFFINKDHPKPKSERKPIKFLDGYKEIIRTFKEMKMYKSVFIFMIAYFFLNDAIATTIAMMTIYATAIVGFTSGEFILLYLVSTVSTIIGSFLFGNIAKAIGARKAVSVVAVIMIFALIVAVFATDKWMFWIAGSLFGVSLGSMWVTSRTLIVELTPEEKRGQFFGLFAFSGKVSAIIGPAIYGTVTLLLKDYGDIASRVALGSLIIMTVIGLLVHLKVKQQTQNSM